jgi:hypothetical protein
MSVTLAGAALTIYGNVYVQGALLGLHGEMGQGMGGQEEVSMIFRCIGWRSHSAFNQACVCYRYCHPRRHSCQNPRPGRCPWATGGGHACRCRRRCTHRHSGTQACRWRARRRQPAAPSTTVNMNSLTTRQMRTRRRMRVRRSGGRMSARGRLSLTAPHSVLSLCRPDRERHGRQVLAARGQGCIQARNRR